MTAAAKAFKSAAQPYIFNYENEVNAFYQDWPGEAQKLYFIDVSNTPNGALIYNPEIQDADAIMELLAYTNIREMAADRYRSGMGGSAHYPEGGFDIVILKTPKNQHHFNLLGHDAPAGMVDAFSFDHEIGHVLVAPEERKSFNLNERLADAYAVIRHMQRFGSDDSTIKNLMAMRALEVVLQADGSHFTSPMVEQIIADSTKMDFSKLSPAETVARAEQYARAFHADPVLIQGMTSSLGTYAHELLPQMLRGNHEPLKKLGHLVLSTIMPDEFKWGALAIRTLLDGEAGFEGERIPAPQGEEWSQLRKALDAREAEMKGFTKGIILVPTL